MEADWRKIVKKYNKPVNWKSNWQVFNSFAVYILCWFVAWAAWEISPWLTLLVAMVSQITFGRLFIIFHDCGHGNFYRSKKARTFWGYMTGIVWWTPYWQWTKSHATHHRNSGNLDERGIGDIITKTAEEYQNCSAVEKFLYRLYRSPLVAVVLSAFYVFFIQYRVKCKHDGKREIKSVHITNIAIVLMGIGISMLTSFEFFAFYQFFLLLFGGILGITFFYVQHQFEEVYWKEGKEWDYETAAIEGCSYMKLPKLLQWASGNIGYHHIHHLSHSIPNYNLEQAYNEQEYFRQSKTLELKDMWGCFRLGLYDAKNKKMIKFSELKSEKFSLDSIKTQDPKLTT